MSTQSDPIRPAEGYAGDITPQTAYEWWQRGEAVLVDVRTEAERSWVGFVPGSASAAWRHWPGMVENTEFDAQLCAAVPAGKKALMLCRSAKRSVGAARRGTELGYECYNILEGFEGDPDEHGHRNSKTGWRVRGLPWQQS